MKRIQTLLTILAAVAAVACSSSSNAKPGEAKTPTTNTEKTENTTDYRVCNTGIPASSLMGRWAQDSVSGDLKFRMVLAISESSVVVSNICSLNHLQLAVQVASASLFDDRNFRILNSDEYSDEVVDAGTRLRCNVAVRPAEVSYSFRGSCLVLSKDGQEQVLVPVPVF